MGGTGEARWARDLTAEKLGRRAASESMTGGRGPVPTDAPTRGAAWAGERVHRISTWADAGHGWRLVRALISIRAHSFFSFHLVNGFFLLC